MSRRMAPRKLRKRNGSTVDFDASKIVRAIGAAAVEALHDEDQAWRTAQRVADVVMERLSRQYGHGTPGVEDIQDLVEATLMDEGYSHVAKNYILYRDQRSKVRFAKSALGLKDDLKLPVNTMAVLKQRYLLRDEAGRVIETPSELFRRVAHHVAQAEANYRSSRRPDEVEQVFYRMLRNREFLPNSPTLMNAGTPLGQLSACFVLPVPDSVEGIFGALAHMARIHQTGGGTGFNFSALRPRGDVVHSTMGCASGPVSFMGIFDKATDVIVQGGKRRGANMGILRCDHPDISDFVEVKTGRDTLRNFNLSVGVTNQFMRAIRSGRSFALVHPRTGKRVKMTDARALFDRIVYAAWRTGDPGLVFLDEINKHNPTPGQGVIEATNPCGEVPLLPYESCILGSINLALMVKDGRSGRGARVQRVDWDRLAECVRGAVRFLDDVIDVNEFPLDAIKAVTRGNRKIGLGVMGFADLLIRLGMSYDSPEAVTFARKLMRFVRTESLAASQELAAERGVFPNFEQSAHASGTLRLRHAAINTVAPTGTISIIAGCSSGIEPLFGVSFVRNVLSGSQLSDTNPEFESLARDRGFYSRELLAEVARSGSLKHVRGIPEDVRRLFVTALEVPPSQHLAIQAAFQKYTDNAVSKTINLPADATIEAVRDIYLSAHRLKCKGITVYRYGSKPDQVLSMGSGRDAPPSGIGPFLGAGEDYAGRCAPDVCDF